MTNSSTLRIAQLSLTLMALCCGTAVAQAQGYLVDRAQREEEADKAEKTSIHSVKLVRVIEGVPLGTVWLKLKLSRSPLVPVCIYDGLTKTSEGRKELKLPPFSEPFKAALQGDGYKVVTPSEDNLFDHESGSADLEVAAVITDVHVEGCISSGDLVNERGTVKGDGSMSVDWQVYSPINKQVVARLTTSGSSRLEEGVPGGVDRLVVASFAANARQLASNADFRAAMSAPKPFTKGFVMPGQQDKIVLAGSLKIPKRQIADATGSVVTILPGAGSGSGFLVSTDGYLLTDAHVVGDEKNVRVRWSDGLETLATVERVSEKRDVAILKTNPRDRAPLALRRGPVTLGARVYAIGSPAGRKFEGTVSSGVMSADRVFDGLRYIQSDTTVSHGSSGGPLLDENGAVIGLTDLAIPNTGPTGEEGPAGLNLFTPIGDAMDFLALEQR
jgi:serine protease Do